MALEEIDDGTWPLFYGQVLLARFDERERRFYGWLSHLAIEATPARIDIAFCAT